MDYIFFGVYSCRTEWRARDPSGSVSAVRTCLVRLPIYRSDNRLCSCEWKKSESANQSFSSQMGPCSTVLRVLRKEGRNLIFELVADSLKLWRASRNGWPMRLIFKRYFIILLEALILLPKLNLNYNSNKYFYDLTLFPCNTYSAM